MGCLSVREFTKEKRKSYFFSTSIFRCRRRPFFVKRSLRSVAACLFRQVSFFFSFFSPNVGTLKKHLPPSSPFAVRARSKENNEHPNAPSAADDALLIDRCHAVRFEGTWRELSPLLPSTSMATAAAAIVVDVECSSTSCSIADRAVEQQSALFPAAASVFPAPSGSRHCRR